MKAKLKDVKKGDYLRLSEGGPVWVRGDYDRALKKYEISRFQDAGHSSFRRGDLSVFVGFTF